MKAEMTEAARLSEQKYKEEKEAVRKALAEAETRLLAAYRLPSKRGQRQYRRRFCHEAYAGVRTPHPKKTRWILCVRSC